MDIAAFFLLQLIAFGLCLRLRHPAIAGIAALVIGIAGVGTHMYLVGGDPGASRLLCAAAIVFLSVSTVAECKRNPVEFNKGNPLIDPKIPPRTRIIWISVFAVVLFLHLRRHLVQLLSQ